MKNNVLAEHKEKQGTYTLSLNEKPSWTSESQAIWFIPQWNQWAIGPLDSLGTTNRGIRSSYYSKDPQNVMIWDYNSMESGWTSAYDDIIVECIVIGNYGTYIYSILKYSRVRKEYRRGICGSFFLWLSSRQ